MHLEKDRANNRMSAPILLPTGRDAELVGSVLKQEQIDAVVCASMREMLDRVRIGCGPFVVGDEAFSHNAVYRLMQTLNAQPEWSDLPGIIFIGRSAGRKTLDLLATRREISLIQRPIKKSLFMSMMQTAVEARLRQYQVKDLLEDLVQTNEKLSSHTRLLQKLAMELTRIEDQERQRIGQILHDDLQQMLAAAKLQTEMLFDYLKDESAQKARVVYDILSEAMKTSRSLSHELNPAFIHGKNWSEALKKLGARTAENYGFQVHSTIDADTDRISEEIKVFVYRSIQELLFNCAKHAGASRVSFDIAGRGKLLTVTMTDDGVGFDPAKLKINGGNAGGFGLYSIQQRIVALGGSFTVQSLPAEGSRFVFKIPLGPERKARAAAEPEAAANGRDRENDGSGKSDVTTVVIADDHAVMRQGLASLLRNQADIEVVAEAEDGEQAVALALQFRPAVVLMDFSMPRLNGIEATRRIKAEAPEVVVIGLSMYAASDTKKRMLEAGAQTYLTKDVQAKELIAAIKQCVHVG
ncbi:MAG: response regulator [Desulfobacterales bacterium]|jgi:signal transduction histidine kinase/ActR/RegA family two-component response regulator